MLTPEEIKEKGFIPIENATQIAKLKSGRYEFINSNETIFLYEKREVYFGEPWIYLENGTRSFTSVLSNAYIGFRPVPDTVSEEKELPEDDEKDGVVCAECGQNGALYISNLNQYFCHAKCCKPWIERTSEKSESVLSVPVESVFEKKTSFSDGGAKHTLEDLLSPVFVGWVNKLACHTIVCHTEIDRLNEVNKAQAEEIGGWEGVVNSQNVEWRVLFDELSSLRSLKEWKPIESVEQLAPSPDGAYEVVLKNGLLSIDHRVDQSWLGGDDSYLSRHCSHYRLITSADEYVAPEPEKPYEVVIGDVGYALRSMTDEIRNQILAAADAIRAGEAESVS